MNSKEKYFETKYGYFSCDGKEYIIKQPQLPRPWVNIICPGEYGFVISQEGTGYSWYLHATLNRLTQWRQDLLNDRDGKFVYITDIESKKLWSATYKPLCLEAEFYECRHGIGYTTFKSQNFKIVSELTVFVPIKIPAEIWILKLKNLSTKKRYLNITSYIEFCMGVQDSFQEFQKLFTRIEYKNNTVLATKTLWSLPSSKIEPMNHNWEFIAFHTISEKVNKVCLNKADFMKNKFLPPSFTQQKGEDAIAAISTEVILEPDEEREVIFLLGVEKTRPTINKIIQRCDSPTNARKLLNEAKLYWNNLLGKTSVTVPDKAFEFLINYWLKYQTISARIYGRTGYYQPGGAYGFRDQLQDSQIFLPLAPELTKKQILLHSAHQYEDGTVQHWWHPITEEGPKSEHSDDLLWLVFVTIEYLKETADFSLLDEKVPYLESDSIGTLYEHCVRSIEKVLDRMSTRGLPLILKGDWNDALSTVGKHGKGESVWLACFLYGILQEWIKLHEYLDKKLRPEGLYEKTKELKNAINKYCWDGNWYIRATKDNGEVIGSKKNESGKIFLNPQVWSVIYNIASKRRISKILSSIEKYLYRDYGPLLLYPAYYEVDKDIGYITRYAPGTRENGGVYTHAACWAIWMECILGRNEKAWELYKKISPVYRGLSPDLYCAEPYVTPGNSDGPDSPYYGRAGWTWYTGSSQWLFKVSIMWILGVRPTYEGLLVQPCLPPKWKGFRIKRFFRNAYYDISVLKKSKSSEKSRSQLLPVFADNKIHKFELTI